MPNTRRSLAADWDTVRAAQHLIETHGQRAHDVALARAKNAAELAHVKRWHAIASVVEELKGTGTG